MQIVLLRLASLSILFETIAHTARVVDYHHHRYKHHGSRGEFKLIIELC